MLAGGRSQGLIKLATSLARALAGRSSWEAGMAGAGVRDASSGADQQAGVSENKPATPSSGTNRFKIYTKTGDKGTSSLYSGERRRKDDLVFEALGDVDELNSCLGIAREFLSQQDQLLQRLAEIQSRLLDVGSAVATPLESSSEFKLKRTGFDECHVAALEEWIDEMDNELPPLKNFILPSGGQGASFLHMARSVCRRAERHVVPLVHANQVEGVVVRYLNRLSDFLFTAARLAAKQADSVEQVYKKVAQTDQTTP